jgi:hypothetical protein
MLIQGKCSPPHRFDPLWGSSSILWASHRSNISFKVPAFFILRLVADGDDQASA